MPSLRRDACRYQGRGSAKAMRKGRSHQARIDAMVLRRRSKSSVRDAGGGFSAVDVDIYTDGSCAGTPGPGGWAAILISHDGAQSDISEIGGFHPSTTNNRMELMAAIAALEAVPEHKAVAVHSDSTYVVDGITSWINGWRRNGWRTRSGKDVLNADMWRRLHAAASCRRVAWTWVKGHAGDTFNARADQLAVEMRKAGPSGREVVMR